MSKLKIELRKILPTLSEEANKNRDEKIKSKYQSIRLVVESRKSITRACAALGKSTDWFYKWARRLLRERTLKALSEQSRKPHRNANRTPKRVEKRVAQIRRAQPYLGPERIQEDLKRIFNIACAPSTIYNVLRRQKLITRETKKRTTKKHIKRYRRSLPGFGQMDVKYVPQLINGKQFYAMNFVDHCTTWRLVRIYESLSHENVRHFLGELESLCPFPIVEIQTDNGQEFTDKYRGGRLTASGTHVLDNWCREHSIRHKLIPIGQKELNGKVENTHKQDDREFYSQNNFRSEVQLRIMIESYNERWNTLRRTKALGWKTPGEALEAAYIRALAWSELISGKFNRNKNKLINWDENLNASVAAPTPKATRKRPSARKKESYVNRFLQFEEWSRKKSS